MIGFILAVAVAAAPSFQGPTPATIDSGMTRAQVVAKLGEPMSTRIYDGHTYLLYKNGCERTCGMSDLVVLDSDKVVDAIFRSSARRYSGTSSSPRMISLADARRGTDDADGAKAGQAAKVVKPAKVAKVIAVDAANAPAKAPAPEKITVVEVPKTDAKSQPAKATIAAPKTAPVVTAPVKVQQVKAEPVKVEPAKVVKVDNGESARPKPVAAPAVEKPAPKLPEVFRPAPTPKKDTTKKSDAANTNQPVKKPAS
jgi:hypothetical protein